MIGSKLDRVVLQHLPRSILYNIYRSGVLANSAAWKQAPFFLVHVPKCAGISVARALDLPDPGHVLFGDLRPEDIACLVDKPGLAIVRNPVGRIISTFKFAHQQRNIQNRMLISDFTRFADVNDFVRIGLSQREVDKHYFLRPAADFVESAQRSGMHVALVDFDSIDPGVPAFFREVAGIDLPLPHVNASQNGTRVEAVLTDESLKKIRSLYSRDYELLSELAHGRYQWA